MTSGAETGALSSQAKNTQAVAQINMKTNTLNIIYRDRKTHIWVTGKTKITGVIEQS